MGSFLKTSFGFRYKINFFYGGKFLCLNSHGKMDKIMYLKINKSINFNLDLDVHFSSHDAAIYKGYDRNILFLI